MITAVILAGGASARFGGQDKGLMCVAGVSLVQRVIDRLAPQVDAIFIIANRSQAAYRGTGLRVLADQGCNPGAPLHEGPLAGILTALRNLPSGLLLTVPVDAALLPHDLAARMQAAGAPAQVRGVPVCALLDTRSLPALEQAWAAGERSPRQCWRALRAAEVAFEDVPERAWSVNDAEQLRELEALLHTARN